MTLFTKSEKEQIITIVSRCMIFRFTDDETMAEIQKVFTSKCISKPTLSRIKRDIKTRNLNMYNQLKMTQNFFLSKVLEKYQNIDTYIKEYFKMYNSEKTSNIIKLKILEKIIELDQCQLRMQQDFPYLELYHKDARDELIRLDKDMMELKEKLIDKQDPQSVDSCVTKNNSTMRIPINSITKDEEIQNILLSRTQSGFEGRL
ncbi:hypothetical protein [Candidatus Nitrosocosmicus sp. FF01]|uniref:hypothetical protein n=1 Tax=Candidatus Nitrosocosmicus sp. FF01 TaxID=3397670 RepID=UPI0039E8E106